jgi:hypothetical protein
MMPARNVQRPVYHVGPSTAAAASLRSSENAVPSSSMLMWSKTEVNRSFLRCLAATRMRSSAYDALPRSCARHVLC